MRTPIVTYLLLYVLKQCWCQITEDSEKITPKHVGDRHKSFYLFSMLLRPKVALGHFFLVIYRSHTKTHHSR